MTPTELRQLRPNDRDPSPKYMQIARKMSELISSKAWPVDHGLPSERQLVELLGVSRVTARRALQLVSEKGLVVRKPGSGTYIAPHLEQPLSRLSGFSEELRLRGMTSSSTWLQRDVAEADPDEISKLGLVSGARVTRLMRLRLANDSPMAIEYSRLPTSLLADPMAVERSLYSFLDAVGTPVVRATQKIGAVNATSDQAKLLEIASGTALIYVTRIGYLGDGRAIELTESFCRADMYDFVAELTRAPTPASESRA